MTKKKHVKTEENEKPGTSKSLDNKDINSHKTKDHTLKTAGTVESNHGSEQTEALQDNVPGTKTNSDKDALLLSETEAKLSELQDKYLRLSAEFDNYRKRTLREKIDLTRHAGENILLSLIPVMDDFERALKVMESAADCVAMKEGIDLIYNKFSEFLKQNGIKEIESENNEFNVDLHEAVTKVPVEDKALKGKVVEVIVKGYYLHDKVLRYSKVVVGE
jgi:molecular chaperone GrpE